MFKELDEGARVGCHDCDRLASGDRRRGEGGRIEYEARERPTVGKIDDVLVVVVDRFPEGIACQCHAVSGVGGVCLVELSLFPFRVRPVELSLPATLARLRDEAEGGRGTRPTRGLMRDRCQALGRCHPAIQSRLRRQVTGGSPPLSAQPR